MIVLEENLKKGEVLFILSGLIPNRKGHPLVHQWFGAHFTDGAFTEITPFEKVLERTQLGSKEYPNRKQTEDTSRLKAMLPEAVKQARAWMSDRRREFEDQVNPKLDMHLKALDDLRAKQHQQVEIQFGDVAESAVATRQRREREMRSIDTLFDEYLQWIEDTLTTEDRAYVQVIAVLRGEA